MKKFKRKKRLKIPFPINELYCFHKNMREQEYNQEQTEIYWVTLSKVLTNTAIMKIIGVGPKEELYSEKWFEEEPTLYLPTYIEINLIKATKLEMSQITLWDNYEKVAAEIRKKEKSIEKTSARLTLFSS